MLLHITAYKDASLYMCLEVKKKKGIFTYSFLYRRFSARVYSEEKKLVLYFSHITDYIDDSLYKHSSILQPKKMTYTIRILLPI